MVYDFIEIGTCDFDTLSEKAPPESVGLCIEPLKIYLDNIKAGPNVVKVNKAVSDRNGTAEIHYIKPEAIEEYGIHYGMKGCNSINNPHPTVKKILGDSYNKLTTTTLIELTTWESLINDYQIKGIRYLKIDTEGHDDVVLGEYFKACENNKDLLAEEILFEYNTLTNIKNMDSIIEKFKKIGYKGIKLSDDYKLVRTN